MIVKTKIGQSPSVDDAIALGNNDIIIDVAVVNKDYYVILTKSNELKLYSIIYNTLQASLPITASLKVHLNFVYCDFFIITDYLLSWLHTCIIACRFSWLPSILY